MSTWLDGYLDWPGVRQVFRLSRERTTGGVKTVEVTFGMTSLSTSEAPAGRLLSLVCAHWGIENRLFGVRDVTLGEDASRVRKGNAPEAMAIVRNAALALLPKGAKRSRASMIRQLGSDPERALKLVTGPTRA